jgi:hypothetical protein
LEINRKINRAFDNMWNNILLFIILKHVYVDVEEILWTSLFALFISRINNKQKIETFWTFLLVFFLVQWAGRLRNFLLVHVEVCVVMKLISSFRLLKLFQDNNTLNYYRRWTIVCCSAYKHKLVRRKCYGLSINLIIVYKLSFYIRIIRH